MTVVLNPAAIAALIETREGPVGRFVEDLARDVAEDAAKLANAYYRGAVDVGGDIGFDMEGSSAIIGYRPTPGTDHKAQRLADAERSGMLGIPPLQTALVLNRR